MTNLEEIVKRAKEVVKEIVGLDMLEDGINALVIRGEINPSGVFLTHRILEDPSIVPMLSGEYLIIGEEGDRATFASLTMVMNLLYEYNWECVNIAHSISPSLGIGLRSVYALMKKKKRVID